MHVERRRRDPIRTAAVLSLPVLCVLTVPVAAWIDTLAPASGPGVRIAGGDGWPWALIGALLGVLAGIILLYDRRQVFGWLLAGFGLFWALDGLAQSYIQAGLTEHDAWPGMTLALWFLNRFGAYLTVVSAILLMVFPTGRFLPGRWTTACWTALGLMVTGALTFLVIPSEGRIEEDLPAGVDPDPTSIDALGGIVDPLVQVALATMVTCLAFALVTVVVRHRRSEGGARDQMRWLAWSAVVLLATFPLSLVIEVPHSDYLTLLLITVLPPAAMTVAIVRPTLVSVQDLLGRTIVLAAILAALVIADVAVLALLTLALDDTLSQAQVVTVVLVVAVLLYGPLRHRLSLAVRRAMLGRRSGRYDVVAGLAATLENTDDPAEQLAAAVRAVVAAFGVRFVSLEVDHGGGERMVTSHGERPAAVRTLPITYRGSTVGVLVLPARGLRSRLGPRDEALVGDLVRQAVAAARTSRLAEEVQESRHRLVTAREEERRRIRRDLHDGLGPALSGMVFGLEAARMRIAEDPDGASAQLATISAQAQAIVGDVRRLVHDLRPPALDDRGLVGALRQQADALGLVLDTRLEGEDLALPAAVEVAAFRIAGEALTNVARHAGTDRAELSLEVREGALLLTVADDGTGIPADREIGVGLLSLHERAAELGGEVEIDCPGGGTRVRARLPLASGTPEAAGTAGPAGTEEATGTAHGARSPA
ncbi:sensor histidine kinase [Nocardioides insulae]|uniref:sensor histidine kinase n=1 Tax=Nocardioides insulae TaxID=394734 RepID=UPI00146BB6AD|nr:sensor histidine kinase [Nocardioides insulae]